MFSDLRTVGHTFPGDRGRFSDSDLLEAAALQR